jgi:hypothetical protein
MSQASPLLKFAIIVVAIIAVLQWIVVGERALAAAWEVYKYAGEGYIGVSRGMQTIFFACSSMLIASAYLLQRLTGLPRWRNLARFVLCFGRLFYSAWAGHSE